MRVNRYQKGSKGGASSIKEESNTETPGMNFAGTSQQRIDKSTFNSSDQPFCNARHGTKEKEPRATSPLDTIAEVACRMGTSLPFVAQPRPIDECHPEDSFGELSESNVAEPGNSDSPRSIPTQEATKFAHTLSERRQQVCQEHISSLRSLLSMLRSYNLETISTLACLGEKLCKTRELEGIHNVKIVGDLAQEVRAFGNAVDSKYVTVLQEIEKVQEELVSVKSVLVAIQRESCFKQKLAKLESNGILGGEQMLRVKADEPGEVSFVIRTVRRCGENDEDVRIDGKELMIKIEGNGFGKRELRSNESTSSGFEGEGQEGKRMKVLRGRHEAKQRNCSAGSGDEKKDGAIGEEWSSMNDKSDCEYTLRGECNRHGLRRKGSKGKVVKRRRDNWTEEENKIFMRMVLENQQVEEMTLRRMLARKFSPRRTHEQCANHLRILRAQNKLPVAKES